jgi:hypothetical protein
MFWSVIRGKPSSGWRHRLAPLGGIARVVFELKPRWAPNFGAK